MSHQRIHHPKGRCAVGILAMATLLLAGCSASVRERHYFATYPGTGTSEKPVSYFRVDVKADSKFSNARYVAGFYDERAVDLFFSELTSSSQTLFRADLKNPGTNDVLRPLEPSTNGAFVMVMSTNADAITGAIGAFADSEAAGRSIVNLVNADDVRAKSQGDASAGAVKSQAVAFTAGLQSRIGAARQATSVDGAKASYLQVLNLIAIELGRSDAFASLDEARIWFQGRREQQGGAQ
jgi:hypothetical protein